MRSVCVCMRACVVVVVVSGGGDTAVATHLEPHTAVAHGAHGRLQPRTHASAACPAGGRLPPRKVGRPNGIAILRLSRQFARAGDSGMPLLGAWAAGSAEHARDMPVLASSGRGARHGRFPLEPIRRAESHGNSTPETDGVWPRGCCVSRARRRRAATCQPPKSAAAAVTGFEANIAGIPKY